MWRFCDNAEWRRYCNFLRVVVLIILNVRTQRFPDEREQRETLNVDDDKLELYHHKLCVYECVGAVLSSHLCVWLNELFVLRAAATMKDESFTFKHGERLKGTLIIFTSEKWLWHVCMKMKINDTLPLNWRWKIIDIFRCGFMGVGGNCKFIAAESGIEGDKWFFFSS